MRSIESARSYPRRRRTNVRFRTEGSARRGCSQPPVKDMRCGHPGEWMFSSSTALLFHDRASPDWPPPHVVHWRKQRSRNTNRASEVACGGQCFACPRGASPPHHSSERNGSSTVARVRGELHREESPFWGDPRITVVSASVSPKTTSRASPWNHHPRGSPIGSPIGSPPMLLCVSEDKLASPPARPSRRTKIPKKQRTKRMRISPDRCAFRGEGDTHFPIPSFIPVDPDTCTPRRCIVSLDCRTPREYADGCSPDVGNNAAGAIPGFIRLLNAAASPRIAACRSYRLTSG